MDKKNNNIDRVLVFPNYLRRQDQTKQSGAYLHRHVSRATEERQNLFLKNNKKKIYDCLVVSL